MNANEIREWHKDLLRGTDTPEVIQACVQIEIAAQLAELNQVLRTKDFVKTAPWMPPRPYSGAPGHHIDKPQNIGTTQKPGGWGA